MFTHPILALQSSYTYDSGSMTGLLLIEVVIAVIAIASLWRIFTKAGKPGWAAIIPIYNLIVLLEIAGKPAWWIILFFIPFVNFIVIIVTYMDLAKAFGQGSGFGCLLILFAPIMFPVLAFGNYKYVGV